MPYMVLAVLWLRRPPGLASVLTALGARDESRQNFVWDLFELPRRRKGHRGGISVSETRNLFLLCGQMAAVLNQKAAAKAELRGKAAEQYAQEGGMGKP